MESNNNMMLTNYVVIGKKNKHYKLSTIINNYKQPSGSKTGCKVAMCDDGSQGLEEILGELCVETCKFLANLARK